MAKPAKPFVDRELIQELTKLLEETGLSEIEIEHEGMRVRVARNAAPAPAPVVARSAPPIVQAMAGSSPAPLDPAKHPGVVLSPMVGTAYAGAEPGAKPFIDVGSTVKAGDTLLIVEAMKVMNPITAPEGGVIKKIMVADAQPVEFDQPLLVIG